MNGTLNIVDELGPELVAELSALDAAVLVDFRPLADRPSWSGRYSAGLTAATLAAHGTVCHLCGLLGASTADHLLPRSRGGSDELANLRPAHRACNSSRQAKSLVEWHAGRPRTYATSTPASRQW